MIAEVPIGFLFHFSEDSFSYLSTFCRLVLPSYCFVESYLDIFTAKFGEKFLHIKTLMADDQNENVFLIGHVC